MPGVRERIAGLFRRQGPPLAEDNLNARDDFEEMRRRVGVKIQEIPTQQWPIRSTEALRLLADCLNKDPYKVAPDISSVINHGIIRFQEVRSGGKVRYLLTPDMFRAFAAYHWTKPWTANNLQGRVGLARQMLGEINPLAALLKDPVSDRKNGSDVGRERQAGRRVVPRVPLLVSYQLPEGESVVFDAAADEAKLAEPLIIGEGRIGGVVLEETPLVAGIKLEDALVLEPGQDLGNKLEEVEKALGKLPRPQARSGIFRKGDILDRSVRRTFGGSYPSLQKFMANVISSGIIRPIANRGGAVEFTRDQVLALVALFIMQSRFPEEDLREVIGRTREVLRVVDLKLTGVINNPLAHGDGLTTVGKDEELEKLREEITLEGAEARADGAGEKPKRKKGIELSEEKRGEIIGKIPQVGDEELKKARAWNRQTIERYMENLSNDSDVRYTRSTVLTSIVLFIAQAGRGRLDNFDPQVLSLKEVQVKRALGICSDFIRRYPKIGNLASLFNITRKAVEENPLYFWDNGRREE